MIDFEVGFQKSIKATIPDNLFSGCFFHYVKLLWDKAKRLGLSKKNKIKHIKI